jgi:hypothetical protein
MRQEGRRFVLNTAYRDHIMAETVCTVSREQVIEYLVTVTDKGVQIGVVPDIEKALVLCDSRGRGSFQK